LDRLSHNVTVRMFNSERTSRPVATGQERGGGKGCGYTELREDRRYIILRRRDFLHGRLLD
jgi:hypothetical protein